ncbi:MAG: hypothetical protein E7159_01170 [Firmicutes bacterium]|nr:hypothetical protein [Bacillota bacterium]
MDYDVEVSKLVSPGKLCVLASRPGVGKSSLARKVAMLVSNDSKVLIIDLDDNKVEEEILENTNITYNRSLSDVDEIVNNIKNNDYTLVVIDYIQLLTSVKANLTKLKNISERKNICILAISQLPHSFNFGNITENEFIVDMQLFSDSIVILSKQGGIQNLTIV